MVIADTGFWLALANRRNRHHARVVEVLETLEDGLALTWPVMMEACYLLALHHLGEDAAERFIRSHEQGAFVVVDPAIHPLARLAALLRNYRDLPMDLADCHVGAVGGASGARADTLHERARLPHRSLEESASVR